MEERVYRTRVVDAFLRAGIPIAKVDRLRGLLEENGLKLTTQFLPIVNAFKAARFFNPEKVTELKPTASSRISFLEHVILNLKAEYLGLAVGVTKIDNRG